MVATYEKLTLASFKKKMKGGGYESIGGARRAIGRMKEWPEADRDKARKAAAKFFGVEETKPAKKTAKKKTAKKKTTKKAATKKASKKTTKRAAKKSLKKKVVGRARAKSAPGVDPVMTGMLRQQVKIGTIQQALDAMEKSKALGAPAADVQVGAKVSQAGLTASVNALCQLTADAVAETPGNGAGSPDLLDKAAAAATAGTGGLGVATPPVTPPEPQLPPPPEPSNV